MKSQMIFEEITNIPQSSASHDYVDNNLFAQVLSIPYWIALSIVIFNLAA